FAQQAVTGATVGGRVTDATGALVSGASVVIRDEERNQTRETTTDDRGRYQFLYLPVGPYAVSAEAPGFARQTLRLTLAIGQAADLPRTLSVEGGTDGAQVAPRA